jgi:lipopolysaccharide export system protein LptA
MRWQKPARLAIAVFVIVFAAIVVVMLQRPAPTKAVETASRRNPDTVREVGAFTRTQFRSDGKLHFTIEGASMESYPDGRSVARKAKLTLPDRQGRTFTIAAGQMEVTLPEDPKQGEISVGKMSRGVRLEASDGLVVLADESTYDEKSGVVTVPGRVRFERGRMTGTGVGATYDEKRDVLWLLAEAHITVKPDEKGGGAIEATAASAGLARPDHYIRLTKPAHVVGEGRTIDTDDLTIQLTDDDNLIESMTLRGNSRITSTNPAGAEGMSARDIDLTYAPDGRTLQQAKLMEGAVVRLGGGAGGPARQISGRTIDMTMGADGSTVTALNATENVQVDLPATADAPARRINSATLVAAGPNGIQTATFAGGVTFHETRPAGRGTPAGERTGRSVRLIAETEPGLGAIQQADFRGNVHIQDGETIADGQRAIYRVAEDSFDVSPSKGDSGPESSVNDGRVLVNARTISFTVGTKKLHAETNVRSSMQPSKGKDGKPAGGKTEKSDGGKVPSMLAQDEPVNVTANRLDYDGAAALATYTGEAKLFQNQTSIYGDTIVVDDRNANLRAQGKVRSVMFFEEVDSKTKTKKLVQTTATADMLFYEDDKRLATYTAGASGRANLVGTQGDVTADRIQLFLKKDVNELERAEADVNVLVKEGHRTATGAHLTYTPANDTYVMTGTPVEIEERAPNDCRVHVGSNVTFQRSSVNASIQNNGVTPTTVKQCKPKTVTP